MARNNIRRRVSPNGIERFEAIWRDASGKQRQQSFRTKEAATKFQTERRADVIRGLARDEDKSRLAFRHYADQLLADKATTLKPQTFHGVSAYMNRYVLPYFGDKPIGSISSATCLAYLRHLTALPNRRKDVRGLTPATIRHAFVPVREVLALAVQDGAVYSNPAVGIKLPTRTAAPKFESQPLEPQSVQAISDAMDSRDPSGIDGLIVRFLANTGLRAAELSGLQIGDIDTAKRLVRVVRTWTRQFGTTDPKSAAGKRTVPLPAWLASEVQAYLRSHPRRSEPTAPVFPARRMHATDFDWDSPIEMGTYRQRRLRPALASANLPVTVRVHDLRHSYGTMLAEMGVPAERIMRLLGHSSIDMALRYIKSKTETFHDHVDLLPDPRAAAKPARRLRAV